MIEKLDELELLEKDLMRVLTPEEEEVVINQGWESLLSVLGFTDDDYKTFRRVEALISAFCTESEERYEEELAKDNGSAKFVLQSIVNDLTDIEIKKQLEGKPTVGKCESLGTHCELTSGAKECDIENCFNEVLTEDDFMQCAKATFAKIYKEADVTDYIKRLKAGETLELDSRLIDRIVEVIWNECEDCNIQIVNNKIRLRK